MKGIFKSVIVGIIQWESRLVLKKYRPKIVAVTGSVGKTSTKDAIYSVLCGFYHVRKSLKSFNSDVGVPLTILGCPNAWNNPVLWLKNIVQGLVLILTPHNYPKWLILEIGADRPDDIKKISKWVRPDVVVVTRFSKVPVHVEFFDSAQALIKEKSHLVKALKKGGTLILNNDDEDVLTLKNLVEAKVITYGLNELSDVKVSNYQTVYENTDEREMPVGVTFKVDYNGNNFPVVIKGSLGLQHIYSATAALAVGISQNLNIVGISEALLKHSTPPGRMKLIEGIKGSLIIDDTYNSSPVALNQALQTLGDVDTSGGGRKIAVLGDMLELGRYSAEEHKSVGKVVAGLCNILVTVGVRARFMAEEALSNGMDDNNILQFDDSQEAGAYLENIIKGGDIILVKGSQSMRMEKVVEEIMAHPENKESLLVRQEEEWQIR